MFLHPSQLQCVREQRIVDSERRQLMALTHDCITQVRYIYKLQASWATAYPIYAGIRGARRAMHAGGG
jgi:hypothetical protein